METQDHLAGQDTTVYQERRARQESTVWLEDLGHPGRGELMVSTESRVWTDYLAETVVKELPLTMGDLAYLVHPVKKVTLVSPEKVPRVE